jgi:Fe-S-cluster containining protein
MPPSREPAWKTSAARAELRALYARVDGMLAPFSCESTAECCRFGVTGREPYVTPVELAEVEHAIAARGMPARPNRSPRALPVVDDSRPCPLLDDAARCRIYDARPLGCRTFFCDRIQGDGRRFPRDEINRAARDLADLAARHAPRDPGSRPLTRALASKR